MKWRFYAKLASETEFIVRFPSAHLWMIAYFGKLFIKTVKGETVFRVTAFAVKPIALDMNSLRIFASVRVRIGCIDVGLAHASETGSW